MQQSLNTFNMIKNILNVFYVFYVLCGRKAPTKIVSSIHSGVKVAYVENLRRVLLHQIWV